MSLTLRNDENAYSTPQLAAHDPSHVFLRPVTLFIKVGLLIIICEAAIEAATQLLSVSSKWDILFDPLLLAVFGTIGLYSFIVSPMNRMLEINEEVKGRLELFRGLLDKSNDAVFIIDPETAKLLDVNYRACTTLGYTRAELLNMTALDIEEVITDGSWAEQVRQVSNNGYVFLQSRHKRKDGVTFPVEVNVNLVNWCRRDYIIAVARDISNREHAEIQLKESEAKFKKVAECAKSGIIMMGPKGEISFWNPAAERIFGYSSDEAIGKDLHTLLVAERFRDAFQKVFSSFQKAEEGNAMGKTLKLAAIRKNGSEFSIEISLAPVQLNGEWHAVGIIRDMSEGINAAWANQGEAAGTTVELTTG